MMSQEDELQRFYAARLRYLNKKLEPKPLPLGARFFANSIALIEHRRRALRRAEADARDLLIHRSGIDDDSIAAELIRASHVTPLRIGSPFSVEVECAPRPYKGQTPNCPRLHLATVTVPYTGSELLWRQCLGTFVHVQLTGTTSETRVRIKGVLENEEPSPIKEYVVEQLDKVRTNQEHHNSCIATCNAELERDLRKWVATNAAVLESLRVEQETKG